MSLKERINILLAENTKGNVFLASLNLKYNEQKNVLVVEYGSLFGLHDIYDIKEGLNQREQSNHVKYEHKNKTLTMLIDKHYAWGASTTTSTDILRLPKETEDIKIKFV
ncbi:hypothetical protein HZA97_02275 [Candidatus Woesearchaeota archaeon]|nr:hypothetical protein [Candidatus Woesearchaeota archaeon]